MSVFIGSGGITLKRAMSTSHYSKKYIFCTLSISGQTNQSEKMKLILFT